MVIVVIIKMVGAGISIVYTILNIKYEKSQVNSRVIKNINSNEMATQIKDEHDWTLLSSYNQNRVMT